jgi:NAD-dependent deacetylase
MELEEKIELAAKWIFESNHLVLFTGAGLSPKSPPWDQVSPNQGHYSIVELLKLGKLDYLISQNVDGLLAKSGIPFDKLAELHGNLYFMKCLECGKKLTFEEAGWDKKKLGQGYRTGRIRKNQPNCPKCGGRIISSIVNFGDPLPMDELEESMKRSQSSDVFFVIGSSLVVTPAANMPGIAWRNGAKLIILNAGETPYDNDADLRFFDQIGEVLPKIVERVKEMMNSN